MIEDRRCIVCNRHIDAAKERGTVTRVNSERAGVQLLAHDACLEALAHGTIDKDRMAELIRERNK